MARVAVGGTFYPLHDGHKALLERACKLTSGGELLIGITSNEMAKKKYHEVEDWEVRRLAVMELIQDMVSSSPLIIRLDDPFGPAIEEDFDYIVVTPETEPTARLINTLRTEQGRHSIKIELVEFVLAGDGRPISSTRILRGEIDVHGNLLPHR